MDTIFSTIKINSAIKPPKELNPNDAIIKLENYLQSIRILRIKTESSLNRNAALIKPRV